MSRNTIMLRNSMVLSSFSHLIILKLMEQHLYVVGIFLKTNIKYNVKNKKRRTLSWSMFLKWNCDHRTRCKIICLMQATIFFWLHWSWTGYERKWLILLKFADARSDIWWKNDCEAQTNKKSHQNIYNLECRSIENIVI